MSRYLKSIAAGILGSISLFLIYWLILFITTRDLAHPISQFLQYKYWMISLLIGFGIQFGLFWYIRSCARRMSKISVASGAGTSTFAMIVCCAHHLVDFLPFLGFSAAALFLSKYQTYFFLLGILSNIAGIIWMAVKIKNPSLDYARDIIK